MPSIEQQQAVLISDGARLMGDRPLAAVGAANFVERKNWRQEGFGDAAELIKREGWQYFRPNTGGSESTQRTIAGGTPLIFQLGEATRPNGTRVPVGVAADKIYWFDFDTSAWVQIASGLATSGIRRYQIVNVGPDVVFNNGVDLPYVWRIGSASAEPLYELREQGYASCSFIYEYNQVLKCNDMLEILPGDLPGIMNGGSPYGAVTDPTKTQRIQFRQVWSNIGNPRDFAAVVAGTGSSGSPIITLAYPMESFEAGDSIVIVGGGTAGGNLTSTILTISGTTLTLAVNLITSVTSASVLKSSALSSIVGFFDLQDDGAPILCGGKLQNREVVYKSNGIFVGYYTGATTQPFAFDQVYSGNRTPKWRYTLCNVGGTEHVFAGDRYFYRFDLGSTEPKIHAVLDMCRRSQFFDLVGAQNENDIYAADNPTTNEIWFFRGTGALAYDYAHQCCDEVTDSAFTAATAIRKPITGDRADESVLLFIMGTSDGQVVQYGRTNLEVLTMTRLGAAFESSWRTGLIDMGSRWVSKIVTSWAILNSVAASSATTIFSLFGTMRDNSAATLLETKTITDADIPTIVYLYHESIYFSEAISCSATSQVRVQGRLWTYMGTNPNGIDRRAASP
jgi:hypothetical protein